MIELLALGILGVLCYIARELKRSNELAAKCEQHLSVLRKSREPALPPPLRLTREDIEQTRR